MRRNIIGCLVVLLVLAFSVNAQDSELLTLDRRPDIFSTKMAVQQGVGGVFNSVQIPTRRRGARRPVPTPTYMTLEMGIGVVGPDEFGKYKVPFSIWFPVPEGTTFTGYSVDVNGNRSYLGHNTVTSETANLGWAGNLWGPYTGGALLPESIVGFEVEFTGNFQTYGMHTPAPGATRPPVIVDVYPNGLLFLKETFAVPPVISLNGRGHPILNGWVTPMEGYTGPDVVVIRCTGFPRSECLTQVVDIPTS